MAHVLYHAGLAYALRNLFRNASYNIQASVWSGNPPASSGFNENSKVSAVVSGRTEYDGAGYARLIVTPADDGSVPTNVAEALDEPFDVVADTLQWKFKDLTWTGLQAPVTAGTYSFVLFYIQVTNDADSIPLIGWDYSSPQGLQPIAGQGGDYTLAMPAAGPINFAQA